MRILIVLGLMMGLSGVQAAAPKLNKTNKPIVSYNHKNFQAKEFRGKAGLEKVEVKASGGAYTLRSKPKPWRENETMDMPLFNVYQW